MVGKFLGGNYYSDEQKDGIPGKQVVGKEGGSDFVVQRLVLVSGGENFFDFYRAGG